MLFRSGGPAALTSAADDKLRPCNISCKSTNADMTDRLREKAVLTAIEAVQKIDDYGERAEYVRAKFDDEEDGYWCCHVDRSDGISQVACKYNNDNRIFYRVGDCYLYLWKCPKLSFF